MSGRRDSFFGDAASTGGAPPARPPERLRPAVPRGRPVRVVAIATVLVVAIAAGVADRVVHRAVAAPAPALDVATVPPTSVESSAWYCAGGTAAPNSAASSALQLVNTTDRPVAGTMRVVAFHDAAGAQGPAVSVPVVVPPHAQIVEVPGARVRGDYAAATVALRGGGVLVIESVAGPLGWSEAPCSRTASPSWFFASGATTNGGTLALSLYNPATTEAVVYASITILITNFFLTLTLEQLAVILGV